MVRTTEELNHMGKGNFTGGLPATDRGRKMVDPSPIGIATKLQKIEDDIDKLHSIIADLEIKFMGVKRYEQICPKGKHEE